MVFQMVCGGVVCSGNGLRQVSQAISSTYIAHTLSNVSRRGSYGFVYMPIAYEYVLRYALDIFARITTCSVLVVLLHGNVEVVTPEVPN